MAKSKPKKTRENWYIIKVKPNKSASKEYFGKAKSKEHALKMAAALHRKRIKSKGLKLYKAKASLYRRKRR